MLSSVLTLFFHCCVILGKESDRKWEEEQITKKEGKEELKDTKQYLKRKEKNQMQEQIQMHKEY